MLFFHASGFHSDVAWLQLREEMATRQSLLGCCSHHGKAQDFKSLWEKSLHCSCSVPKACLEGRRPFPPPGQSGETLPLHPGKPTESKTSLWPCYICHQQTHCFPGLGKPTRKCASALQATMNMARSDTGRLKKMTKFHTKIEVKEFFLILSYTSLISTLKSFIEPWQLNGKLSCCSTERRDRFSNSCLISLSTWKSNRFKDLRKASEHLVPSNNAFQFPLAETGITLSLSYQLYK